MCRDVLRLRVLRTTDDGIDGVVEEGRNIHLRLCAQRDEGSELLALVHEGSRLNLIGPRTEDDAVVADFVIYEPDMLVDISAVAHCFESYGETSLTHLLHRLQPPAQSEAILLGHLASQMLDEAVHSPTGMRPYSESIHDFFGSHGLQVAMTAISRQFHTEAQAQQQHIKQVIDETLPRKAAGFRREEAMLEPSFFSETWGLQGRMDLLTRDISTVLEQKSGRGAFVPGSQETDTPVGRIEHRVQLLLYRLLLRSLSPDADRASEAGRNAFLLYSHYANGLLPLNDEWTLTRRAIRLRNLIAYQELRCADGNGFDCLTTLKAEDLNQRHTTGRLWTQYQKPQIEALLHPIAAASETERAYYLRLLRFVAQEHKLAKMGVDGQEGSGFASKWKDTLEAKRREGTIFDALTLESLQTDKAGRVTDIRLRFRRADDEASNFRKGDIVVLYAYRPDEEPDVRKAIVFRATIDSIDTDGLTLHLRAAQTDAHFMQQQQEKAWAVEHDFFESSFNALYQGLHAFLSAPQRRRDLLLLRRRPESDPSLTLSADYGAFNTLALRAKQARDFFLIVGPPGTGKTTYGLMTCLQEELTDPQARVLLIAFTNRAVDEICSKLKKQQIDFVRVGSKLACASDFHGQLLEEFMRTCPDVTTLRRRITQIRVVVGTTASLTAHQEILQLRGFSLAIIDEASQLLEPHLTGLLSAHKDGMPSIRRFIMIGDQKQLPAVVAQTEQQSSVAEPLLLEIGLTNCRRSLFERLLTRYATDPQVTFRLIRQGRMHRDIAAFPNHFFYGGVLEEATERQREPLTMAEGTTDRQSIEWLLETRRTVFLATRPDEASDADKVNLREARLIAAIVAAVYRREKSDFDFDKTIGVIVPYRNQITAVRRAIRAYGIEGLEDICIDTVERYQGSQRQYIIYGFTVQKDYQLEFLTSSTFLDWDGTLVDRKLNVALTRAEEHLILVGNPDVLAQVDVFNRMIAFFRERHCYMDIAEEDLSSFQERL